MIKWVQRSNAKIYFLPAVFFDTSNFLSVEVRSVICTHYNLGRKWWGNKLFQMFVSPIWFWLSDVFISRCKFTSINSWKHSFSFERLAVPQCNFCPRIFSWLPKITHAASLLAKPDTKSVILCGIETHACIYHTSLDLIADHDIDVHVVVDCCSSR